MSFCQNFCHLDPNTEFWSWYCFQCFITNRLTFHWMLLLAASSRQGKRGTNFMRQTTRWSLVYKQRCLYFPDYPVSVLILLYLMRLMLTIVSKILLVWCLFSASIQENELSKSIDSCNVEAGVVKTWVNFLEDTWQLQSSYNEQKENKTMYVVIVTVHAFNNLPPFCPITLFNLL
jgi:hypothetical protein